jgi:hypothetical protein
MTGGSFGIQRGFTTWTSAAERFGSWPLNRRGYRVGDILVSRRRPWSFAICAAREKNLFQRDIEGKRYDICSDCWSPLAKKLEGKGKSKEDQKPSLVKEAEESPTLPGDH